MSFFIRIKHSKRLVIPKDSGYVPPNPKDKDSVSFSGRHMATINSFMAAVGVIDPGAMSPHMASTCAKGKIPGYKFNFNDGEMITAAEAGKIADALASQDIFAPAFIKKHFKHLSGPLSEDALKLLRELLGLWIAFNRVAAANGGYTVH
jgi:hypothetical protein